MKIVTALGGNALLRRGQPMSAENQRANVRIAVRPLAQVHAQHDLIILHGNGPQVGLLALMDQAYTPVEPFPLDVLGAETVGMIGYVIEQELGNLISPDDHIVTVLTQVVVDPRDPAFEHPAKPVGPLYGIRDARRMEREKGWVLAPDGNGFRRVVASPEPRRIVELDVIRLLVDHGVIVICAGGGGIPVAADARGRLTGVEAVIDKDLAGGLLAKELNADWYIMLTDAACVYDGFGTPRQRPIRTAHPDVLEAMVFAEGSMAPKVHGACRFVRETGARSAVGRPADLGKILRGEAGTLVTMECEGIEFSG